MILDRHKSIISASCKQSSASNHLVVIADVPIRIHDGSSGLRVSLGILFLFVESHISSRDFSACLPANHVDNQFLLVTSMSIIWLSVHHVAIDRHLSDR